MRSAALNPDAMSGSSAAAHLHCQAPTGHPQLRVLDEPTSVLDQRSELLLHESLTVLSEGPPALFVVAHRMLTIDTCNRVIVIAHGELEASDTAARFRRDNAYSRYASALAGGTAEQSLPCRLA